MSSSKLSISFDMASMYDDLIKSLTSTLLKVVDDMVNDLNQKDFSYASNSFRKELMESGIEEIKYKVGSDHWYSFIANYGKGSQMRIDNEQLGKYISSGFWNPDRNDLYIRTRPKGKYKIPDWEGGHDTVPYTARGAGGYNLEGSGDPRYQPFRGDKPVEKTFERAREILKDELKNTFNAFPFLDYVKGGG